MIITINGLRLVSEANTNFGLSRDAMHAKKRRVKAQREAACSVCRKSFAADGAPQFPVNVQVTRIAPRALDFDNLQGSAKHVIDGIADAYGVPDSDPDFHVLPVKQRKGAPREYAVEIAIEPRTHDCVCRDCGRAL